MKNIDGYISDLLYSHDCVILPEFGGFVTSYAPSHMHPSRRILYPPSKNILFNIRLQTNDGLLANYMAEQEKIHYQEAVLLIQQFTSRCLDNLKEKRPVAFENLGTFTCNKEGTIEFTPSGEVNYLEDAFGLSNLVPPPLTGKKGKPERSPDTERRSTGKSSHNKKIAARLAFVTALLAVTAGWAYYHSPLFKDIYTNYSGIIPLIRASHQQSAVIAVVTPEEKGSITETRTPPAPEIVSPVTETAAVQATVTPSAPPESQERFYIIAGAFKEERNATSLINQLKNKGFDARMAGRTKGGLYRVCYGAYTEKKQACQALETIRQLGDQEAWLMVE